MNIKAKLGRKLAAGVLALGMVGGIAATAATVAPGVASASTGQEGYKWNWDHNWNWLWINWNGPYVTTQQAQVQNLNRSEDAFTIRICSAANCPTYGPYYLPYGDAVLVTDVINLPYALPGFSTTYDICEYAVGCTEKTLTLFGILNNN